MAYLLEFNETNLAVDNTLNAKEQILAYGKVLHNFQQVDKQIKIDQDKAELEGNGQLFLEIHKEQVRISKLMLPFEIARAKAINYKEKGHLLNDYSGEMEPTSAPESTDPLVSLLMIVIEAVTKAFLERLKNDLQNKIDNENLLSPATFDQKLVLYSGMFVVQAIRDMMFNPNDNNELNLIVRDPLKRPVEIIENIAKGAEEAFKNDNGDVGNVVKKILNW